MTQKDLTAQLENERLFGEGVDLFKNYHAVLSISGILKNIGLRTSRDNDWYRAVASYLKQDEIAAIYDKIIKPSSRRAMAESIRRGPPELTEDDPDDIISFLTKNLVHRKKLWHLTSICYEKRIREYEEALAAPGRELSATEARVAEMKELFALSDKEIRIVMTIFLSGISFIDLGDFDVARYRNGEKIAALAKALSTTEAEISDLLGDEKNIRKYGLLDEDLDLDRTFMSYLSGISSTPLAERFWVKYTGEVLPWEFHGALAEKHGTVLKKMILSKPEDGGISVLLYGVPGSGKTSFAVSLADTISAETGVKRDLYFIAQNDEDNRRMSYSAAFRYAALRVAQKQLDPQKSILVIDECDKLVENSGLGGGLLSRIFGGDIAGSRDGETKGQLNSVIDANRHTVLWICNSKSESVDPSSRRRFDYNIFFDDLSATSRTYIWKNALKFHECEGKLSDCFIEKASSRYPVNPGGIALAVKNAANVCRKDPALNFEQEVMVFLKAHCSLLGIQESLDELMEPSRDYSLEGLNIRSGIKLPRLIDACKSYLEKRSDLTGNRDQPRLNILLHGVPGSGKSEFVKYLVSKELGKKLLIRNAADLLNMYVGGTEQRICAAFAEAEANDQVLFIDEGDSLLGARDNAVRSWEVSQVNTLLTCMESFRGILIISTNLISRLDQAAMRRFSFRLHFDYLTNEGKETFFKTYFTSAMGLPELNDEEKKALHVIETMTPSDFRNVRQQFYYLADQELTNSEIIEALSAEVTSKNSGSSYKGLGNIVHKMGF